MVSRPLLFVFLIAMVSPLTRAQNRVGPVYSENKPAVRSTGPNYDPFIFNWSSGRFEYAPEPFDTRSGPYAFNWYSGRWTYIPSELNPNPVYTGREPERIRGSDNGAANVATVPPREIPSLSQAGTASATIAPAAQSPQLNRPAPMLTRRAFNYTTDDPNFDSWYRSATTK
jgi:hypothetical protein